MGGILWLYQTLGLIIISVRDTEVTKNTHGHEKKIQQQQQTPQVFNLIKVRCPSILCLSSRTSTLS